MPGRPSLDCPTSCPQFPQNRLFSGTRGSARIAVAGSRAGTGGTATSPAPSLPREDRALPGREPRVLGRLPVPTDTDPDPQPRLAAVAAPLTGGAAPLAAAGTDAGAEPAAARPAGTATGASPQMVQYPSSIVPPHPRWVHATAVIAAALP
jgi:hypothetical protein